MTAYDYETYDVFTDTRFGGNPLAVITDARGLSSAQMQAIAAEFNYSETTFVLPPDDTANTAQVRIFTPRSELPFAGHPNIGTAVALARAGRDRDGVLRFEEAAGLVVLDVLRNPQGDAVAARLEAPQPLRIGAGFDVPAIAGAAGLAPDDILTTLHAPLTAGVGVDFVIAEVTGDALTRAQGDAAVHASICARFHLCLYARTGAGSARMRMFAPNDGIAEDPATGSAAVALAALICQRSGVEKTELTITQGVEMGRPSRLEAAAWRAQDGVRAAVAGGCVPVMRGVIEV